MVHLWSGGARGEGLRVVHRGGNHHFANHFALCYRKSSSWDVELQTGWEMVWRSLICWWCNLCSWCSWIKVQLLKVASGHYSWFKWLWLVHVGSVDSPKTKSWILGLRGNGIGSKWLTAKITWCCARHVQTCASIGTHFSLSRREHHHIWHFHCGNRKRTRTHWMEWGAPFWTKLNEWAGCSRSDIFCWCIPSSGSLTDPVVARYILPPPRWKSSCWTKALFRHGWICTTCRSSQVPWWGLWSAGICMK